MKKSVFPKTPHWQRPNPRIAVPATKPLKRDTTASPPRSPADDRGTILAKTTPDSVAL